MKEEGGMDDQLELRHELARLIRENIEEISQRLERSYVETYPHARANQMDVRDIHQWTLDELELVEQVIETGDPSLLTYQGYFGDALEDPNDPELTAFATFVSTMLFEARNIAPVVFRSRTRVGTHAYDLMRLLEHDIQMLVAHSCDLYAKSLQTPGVLLRTWNLTQGIRPQSTPEETPATRYQPSPDHDMRAAQDTGDPTRPELDWLSENAPLSKRERDVLNLLVNGKTNAEIAAALNLRQNTVKNHVAHIFDKCNVNTRTELTALVLGGKTPRPQ